MYLPADTSTLDGDGDFSMFQVVSTLYTLERWRCITYPEFVFRIGIDTNIWLGEVLYHLDGRQVCMYVCTWSCSLRREYRSSNQSVKNERRRIISSPEQTKFSDAEVTRRRSIFTFHTYLASPSKTKRVVSRGLADFLLRCWIPRIAFTIQAPKVPPPRTPHLLILFGVEEVQSIDSADQQRLLLRDAV